MNTLNTSEAEKNIIIVPDFQVYPCKTFSCLSHVGGLGGCNLFLETVCDGITNDAYSYFSGELYKP